MATSQDIGTWKLSSIGLLFLGFSACGNNSVIPSLAERPTPNWETYRAEDQAPRPLPRASRVSLPRDPGRFTFYDLKNEDDASLAVRLLGQNGKRIAYIDRHPERWQYYSGDQAPIQIVDLYTHPSELGSQYGLCGVEKYSFSFDDNGKIGSVVSDERFGIEGDIFQRKDFDWAKYTRMCESAPASHAPSYFPATDSIAADDAAQLLGTAIDVSASSTRELPFRLTCVRDEKSCSSEFRAYLGKMRLKDIDEFTVANCPVFGSKPKDVCFTIEAGRNQLGPFPKYITVRGSTYMNNIRIDSIDVIESFTIS
jgi:hypothetical protein